ncbi:hypothetical protein Q1695_000929 [Nippostrongylus brasiliensis]|nr:hypothetical protein Q1695_000929 [Nippostrongylus brasiliensis]
MLPLVSVAAAHAATLAAVTAAIGPVLTRGVVQGRAQHSRLRLRKRRRPLRDAFDAIDDAQRWPWTNNTAGHYPCPTTTCWTRPRCRNKKQKDRMKMMRKEKDGGPSPYGKVYQCALNTQWKHYGYGHGSYTQSLHREFSAIIGWKL